MVSVSIIIFSVSKSIVSLINGVIGVLISSVNVLKVHHLVVLDNCLTFYHTYRPISVFGVENSLQVVCFVRGLNHLVSSLDLRSSFRPYWDES